LIRAGNPIDVLFTDAAMPGGMSGIELANQAVSIQPALKVLITTGTPAIRSCCATNLLFFPSSSPGSTGSS